MSGSSEPGERVQYSVAELIARYGDATPSTGRRRRRAPEEGHAAPQSIIERVHTDSVPLSAVESPGERYSADPALDPHGLDRAGQGYYGPGTSALEDRGWTDVGGAARFTGPGDLLRDDTLLGNSDLGGHSEPGGRGEPGGHGEAGGRSWGGWAGRGSAPAGFGSLADQDGHGSRTYRSGTDLPRDNWANMPLGAGFEPLNGRTPSAEPITDQLPRMDPPPVRQVPMPEQRDAGKVAAREQMVGSHHPPLTGEPAAGLGGSARVAVPRRSSAQVPGEDLVDEERLLGCADEAETEAASPVREWIVMATQIGVGVIGGAVLWLICEWLWQRIPVVALVVALTVITGLVWVVRRVRRAEDLQTTVIAVLVGLFVTVSPAALLLVGR